MLDIPCASGVASISDVASTRVELVTFSTTQQKASKRKKQFQRLEMFDQAAAVIFVGDAEDHISLVCARCNHFGHPRATALLLVVGGAGDGSDTAGPRSLAGAAADAFGSRVRACASTDDVARGLLEALEGRAKRAKALLDASTVQSEARNILSAPSTSWPPPLALAALAAGALAVALWARARRSRA
jgi:hypothetical protein